MSNGARAIVSLAQFEDRLRRALGLVGEVGLSFRPEQFTPVILTGDATRPGCSTNRGRRFGLLFVASTVTVTTPFKWRFSEKVVITSARSSLTAITASTPPTWRIIPPGVADPAATYVTVAAGAGSWREGLFASDGPPVEFASNGSTGLGRAVGTMGLTVSIAGEHPLTDVGIEAGGVLVMEAFNSTTNLVMTIEGEIF